MRPSPAVPFDRALHRPLAAQGSVGASASGIAFAPSTGDIAELTFYGAGIFRVRAEPDTRPDCGSFGGSPGRAVVRRSRVPGPAAE